MSIFRVFASLFLLLFTVTVFAQKAPMKWGKVSEEDLQMTEYELDPDAEAVVLGDYGTIEFVNADGNMIYKFIHHRRVKILKKSGVERGDISISFNHNQRAERIKNLKAQVFFPDGRKEQLKRKDIFEEKVTDYWAKKKFAFPKLQPGCVIEYKYTKMCDRIFTLEDWYFQEDIPVRFSELQVDIPEIYQYVYLLESGAKQIEKLDENGLMVGGTYKINRVTFKMKDVAAMKRESHITTMRDYLASVRFQLKSYVYGNGTKEVITTWENLAKELKEHSKFGSRYSRSSKYSKLTKASERYIDKSASDLDKIKQSQAFITNEMEWNGDYSMFCRSGLNSLFEKKVGTSGEINMMLLALLNSQGIKAYPMLSSTRGHGRIVQLYPIVEQFNHLMVYVELDGKPIVLDALDAFHPVGYPHSNSLNHFGLVLDGESSKWAAIKTKLSTQSTLATLALNSGGDLTGTLNGGMNGYYAIYSRKRFADSPKYGGWDKKLKETYPDSKVDSLETIGLDDINESLKVNVGCTIKGAAQVNGDFIYLNPVLLPAYDENPYKLEKRNYPVDLIHPWKENYILNLTIPEGYVIEELPEPVLLVLPEKGGRFNFQVKKTDETHIQLVSKVDIKQLYFTQEEYPGVKKFVDLIVEKQGEQIVLKKKK